MLAAYRETGYNVMLFLHILTVLVAFAPAFVHPLLAREAQDFEPTVRGRLIGAMSANGRRIYAPALILAGLFGLAMQGMSDSVVEFGQTWFWLSIVIWIAMNGVVHGMILPGERAVAGGDQSAIRKVDLGGLLITVLLLVTLYLMVFKPGF